MAGAKRQGPVCGYWGENQFMGSRPPEVRDFSADTPQNRQRSVTINWEVPYHPIVTWQDNLMQIEAMHEVESTIMTSMKRVGITQKQIKDFYAKVARERKASDKATREAHERYNARNCGGAALDG